MATQEQAENFIAQIAPIVQKYAKQYGYGVASPIIAQACCESAYGQSSLGYKYHNYFGMKCGSGWKGKSVNLATKEEYKVGTLTNIKANFRVYDSMDDGVKGYFEFIYASRYKNLHEAKTAQQYLELIKADGYATSSTYVSTNMSIVSKYNLTRFDTLSQNVNPYPVPTRNLKLTLLAYMRGDDVKWLQYELILAGFLEPRNEKGKSNIDGIFGVRTKLAVVQFQHYFHLVEDGIVGVKTRNAILNLK